MNRYLFLIFGFTLLVSLPRAGVSQQIKIGAQPEKLWLVRAQSLTDDLLYDAPRMNRFDRALVWARMGEIWWKTDRQQGRNWFLKAIELLELDRKDEKSETRCGLAVARTILPLVATKDKDLYERMVSLLSANVAGQDTRQRQENAAALASAGVSLVANDPQGAIAFGEASLNLGFSQPLASLLWRLYARDQSGADKLFMRTLQVASATRDIDCLSALVAAAFQGPFSAENYRKLVLMAVAQAADTAEICRLEFAVSLAH